MTFSPCFDRTIFAVLFLALCYAASGANILSLDGETVFGQSFRQVCDTRTTNGNAIAQFYRSTDGQVGTDVGGAYYMSGSPHSCAPLDNSDAKYTHDCAADGSQIYLIVPASNGDEHGTNWRCQTNMDNLAGNNNVITISIIVQVTTVSLIAPPTEVGNMVSVVKSSPENFQCQTSPGRPAATIQWFLDGAEHAGQTSTTPSGGPDMVVTTGAFIVNVDTSYQGKEIYCTATSSSSMTPIELSPRPTLNVQYISDATIHVSGDSKNQYDVTVNQQNFDLTCRVTGANPQPSFSWTKDSQPIPGQTEATYRISSVQRSHDGTYSCTATNAAGSSTSSTVRINVQYSPEINDLNVVGASKLEGQPNAYQADEGGSVQFTCPVDSNPPSSVTWRKTGSDAAISNQTSTQCSNTAVTFTCTASNGIGTASSSFQLYVRCHPRLDQSASVKNEVYGTVGESVQMVIHVIAYPPPTFTWRKLSSDGTEEELPASAQQTDDASSSTVDISNIQEGFFGNYTVTVSNEVNKEPPFKYQFHVINVADPTPAKRDSSKEAGLTGAAVGGTVGGIVVCAAVVAIVVFVIVRRRKSKGSASADMVPVSSPAVTGSADGAYESLDPAPSTESGAYSILHSQATNSPEYVNTNASFEGPNTYERLNQAASPQQEYETVAPTNQPRKSDVDKTYVNMTL